MAFGTFTLTGHFDAFGGAPATGVVRIEGIPNVVIDTAGDKIKVGPKSVVLDTLGNFSIALPSNSTTGDSTGIGFRVTADLKGLSPVGPVEFYAKPIGSTLDMADITPQVVEPVGDTAANVILAQEAADRAQAYTASVPYVNSTPPADTSRLWIDTSSVFTTDLRTQRDSVNVTAAGTVNVTLGTTPTAQSELIWRTRAGSTVLLQPTTNYTLSGTALSVPSSQAGDVLTVRYNYLSVNGTSAGQSISDQPFIVDSFDRANSTTTLGNTDTGQAWTVPLDFNGGQPVWGITSNTAYSVSNPNLRAFALVDTGRADYAVQAKMTWTATGPNFGLIVGSDTTGAASYTINFTSVAKWTSGTASNVFTWPSGTFVTGDSMRVTRKGDKISVYRQAGSTGDFVLVGEGTDATYHGTYVGLNARATSSTGRWDDFKVFAA